MEMHSTKTKLLKAHGTTRALKRYSEDILSQGDPSVKKLPGKMLRSYEDLNLKKYSRCKDIRCKTCPCASDAQIKEDERIFCKTKNVIYLIICLECQLGYVGQTCLELNKRINGHRSNIKNCKRNITQEHEILHFQEHNFDKIDICILQENIVLNKRLENENYFMCKLKTLYPYGLNSKLNFEGVPDLNKTCIYNKFQVFNDFSGYKNYRGKRGRGNKSARNKKLDLVGIEKISKLSCSAVNIKMIKTFILGSKERALKWFINKKLKATEFISATVKKIFLDLLKFKLKNNNLEDNIKIEKEKIYCVVKYMDKIFEDLEIAKIFRNNKELLPLCQDYNIAVAFKYTDTLKKIITNYNYYSHNLKDISEEECYCRDEKYKKYINREAEHIITGDLDIIEDKEVKMLFKHGSKFRVRKKVNLGSVLKSINQDLDNFIVKMNRKSSWPVESYCEWKFNIIKDIKNNYKKGFQKHKGIFLNRQMKDSIKDIKDKFIITLVDKAANNFAILCKKFFKNLILKELNSNDTYLTMENTEKEIYNRINAINKKLKIKNNTENKIPYIFPVVKFHKNPVGFRFVTCSTGCYNRDWGNIFNKWLNIILNKIRNKEKNFIISDNREILKTLNNSKINKINTYDFENLYTTLPHKDLIEMCLNIYEEYLKDENINFADWFNICTHNITDNLIFNGLKIYKQNKGIPMGSSFSSALANIFLHKYEKIIIEKYDIQAYRYIDDLIVFNYDDFSNVKDIYPKELTLKKTNKSDKKADFLDININILDDKLITGLFDKRSNFNFEVITLINSSSNLNSKIFRNIFYSQFNRIKKICNNKKLFSSAITNFKQNLIKNGYIKYLKELDSLIKKATFPY